MKGFYKIFSLTLALFCATIAFADTFTMDVGQFEKLKINGNIAVVYKNLPDSTGLARYEAAPNENNLFSFSVKNDGTLKLEPADDRWGYSNFPIVYLYSDFLTSVENYSDREVYIENLAPCSSFNINQIGNGFVSVENVKCNNLSAAITTGNGSVNVSGVCMNANFRMVGTGLISADRLEADNVKCRILGTGSIGCWPLDNLNVSGLGTTKIYYKGSPNIRKTGGGKLFQLPEELPVSSGTEIKSLSPSGLSEEKPDSITDYDEDDEEDEDEDVNVNVEDEEEYQTVVTEDD